VPSGAKLFLNAAETLQSSRHLAARRDLSACAGKKSTKGADAIRLDMSCSDISSEKLRVN